MALKEYLDIDSNMILGLIHGRISPEENPQPVWDMVHKYVAEFKDKFRYVN